MASRQQKNGSAPIVILSDSDSDAPEAAPQRPSEQRKRSSSAAGGNASKGARLMRCEDCKTLCPVQIDHTPTNSGRNFIHCEACNDIQWVSSNQSSQPLPPAIDSDDDIVYTGSKPAPPRASSPDVVFVSSSLAAPSTAARPPPTQHLVLPSASVPLSVGRILAQSEQQRAAYAAPPATRTGSDCPICQDEMKSLASLGCGHVFCFSCIQSCLKDQGKQGNCPICRKKATLREIRRVYLP